MTAPNRTSAISAEAQSGSQIAMSPMTNTANAMSVSRRKANAIPNHLAAFRFALTISAISCLGS